MTKPTELPSTVREKRKLSKLIPSSVRELLKQPWKPQNKFSLFDFVRQTEPASVGDPSFYFYRPETKPEEVQAFSGQEAKALLDEGVFGKYAFLDRQGRVVVNEHYAHALSDCLSEIYDAWRKYEMRVSLVDKQCPPSLIVNDNFGQVE